MNSTPNYTYCPRRVRSMGSASADLIQRAEARHLVAPQLSQDGSREAEPQFKAVLNHGVTSRPVERIALAGLR